MPKKAKELSAIEVKRLHKAGFYAVGGVPGLHLRVNEGEGRSWILRAVVNDARRDIGLGGYPDVSLSAAREAARVAREKIRGGVDPVEERAGARRQIVEDQKLELTFAQVTEQFLSSDKLDALRNAKHRAQWRSTLETYAIPLIGSKRLVDVDVSHIKEVLGPIWQTKHETASRLRSRLETVLSWATVSGMRSGENPARWRGNLKELMPVLNKAAIQEHHPALPITDVAAWFADLRKRDGLAAKAVEFLALTAARSQEVRFATWDEIDFKEDVWVVPAERMKMHREHRVPLTAPVVTLLKSLPRMAGTQMIFPSAKLGSMSDMTLSAVMKRMHQDEVKADRKGWFDPILKRPGVPHGLRSTFRDWVAEKTDYPGDMAEFALAHKVGTAVERAYRRGDMLAKRRQMMQDWAEFIIGVS